jgi:acetate kinase
VNVLALNAGSNTLRYKLVAMPREEVLKEDSFDNVKGPATAEAAARAVADCLPLGVHAVGYRVVHGGPRFTEPVRITPEVLAEVRSLEGLAPLHVPTDLEVIAASSRAAPGVPGIAVFDTAFHRTLPELAWRYALPEEAGGGALRRYGFHGIAHQFVVGELLRLLGRDAGGTRLISCHLGGGASVCAVRDGRSIDTSMGLTPLEGLVMSTRSGDVDPGLVLYLLRHKGLTAKEVEDLLYRRSGLLGLSGRSGDIRELEPAAADGDRRAELALEVQAYRVRKYIGAYAAALEGLDAVALSGALAEHSAGIRRRALRGLEFLGIQLDDGRNQAAGPDAPARVSAGGSAVLVWLVPADEERQIARETYQALARTA